MAGTVNWPRLLFSIIVGAGLLLLLAIQAMSAIFSKSNPELSAALLTPNGAAYGKLAFGAMQSGQANAQGEKRPSAVSLKYAQLALRQDPLETKAHLVLALNQSTDADRAQILTAASQLNRRDLSLRGLILARYLEAEDYDSSIITLDQILRVHPQYSSDFFPVLLSAFVGGADVSVFADLLDGSSPWHEKFLSFAVQQAEALPNLALLRRQIKIGDERFQKELIVRLAANGQIQEAFEVYQDVSNRNIAHGDVGKMQWRSDYAPFDWRFADEAGFRVQPSQAGDAIDISVKPGKGGQLAQVLWRKPQGPFSIKIDHTPLPENQAEDVQLQAVCPDADVTLLDQNFSLQASEFNVPATSVDCPYFELAIVGRAWSGRGGLNFSIQNIEIIP